MCEIGIIKFFNYDCGFGFIILENGGKDVFVYVMVFEQVGFGMFVEGVKIFFVVEDDCCGCGKQVVQFELV